MEWSGFLDSFDISICEDFQTRVRKPKVQLQDPAVLPKDILRLIILELNAKAYWGLLQTNKFWMQLCTEPRIVAQMKDKLRRCRVIHSHPGKIVEHCLPNGTLDGSLLKYNVDGTLIGRSFYKNGRLEGFAETFYNNGPICISCTYVNNKMEGVFKVYYENGKLNISSSKVNGVSHGPHEIFYETGKLASRVMYKNGERDGDFIRLFGDGTLWERSSYKNGKKDGLCYYHDLNPSGKIMVAEHYKDGELLDRKLLRIEDILLGYLLMISTY